jgi:hypothetical protein
VETGAEAEGDAEGFSVAPGELLGAGAAIFLDFCLAAKLDGGWVEPWTRSLVSETQVSPACRWSHRVCEGERKAVLDA